MDCTCTLPQALKRNILKTNTEYAMNPDTVSPGWEERRREAGEERSSSSQARMGEREKALPLLSALANRSSAPPGAAAARCLRTDYAAFRDSREF
ncbi:hypothetical protein PAMP_010741 [Pampus punctatissimus]